MWATRAALAADLSRLGLAPGDVVMVHAGLRAVGPVLGGPDALIAALGDAVGAAGTVVGYASCEAVPDELVDDDGRVLPEWRGHLPGFDPAATRAVRMNGAFPEFLRTTPGARRSANPGASVVALGARAEWLTAEHPLAWGFGPGTPFARLVEAGGRVLMLGAPWDTMTLHHHADHLARVPAKRVLRYEMPFAAAGGVEYRWIEEYDTGDPPLDWLPDDYIERAVAACVAGGGGRRGRIGRAPALLVDAPAILAVMVRRLEEQAAARPAA